LRPARIGRGAQERFAPEVRGDFIAWLSEPELDAEQRLLTRLEELRVGLNRGLMSGLEDFHGHFAFYPAGAAFPGRDGAAGIVKWPEVRLLAVEPAARGQGVGNALMHACIQRARAAEAEALTLHTTPMMASAMRLYARLGFVHVPELDFEPAPGLTVRGFRLTLES